LQLLQQITRSLKVKMIRFSGLGEIVSLMALLMGKEEAMSVQHFGGSPDL